MSQILKVNYYKLGILLDLDCPGSEEILRRVRYKKTSCASVIIVQLLFYYAIFLLQFTSNRLPYNETYYWMMTTTNDVVPREILEPLPLSINSEMTVVLQGNGEFYSLYDVYNPSYRHGGKLNVTFMGNWSPENGLIVGLNQYKYIRRGNLHGMYLNFSIVVSFRLMVLQINS